MAFIQKPLNQLSKKELKENIEILKSGEDFPNKDKITDIETLIKFHEEELDGRHWWQKDDPLIDDNTNADASKDEKIKSWIDDVFSWGEQGASIVNKIKGGASVNVDGDKYDITPGESETEVKNNKMMKNVIIGVVIFIVLGISALMYMKSKKNASKGK